MLTVTALIAAAVFAIVTATWFSTREACATEYSLTAYLADPDDVARVVGCSDPAFAERLIASPLPARLGLDDRFTPPETWRDAVRALVDGRPRDNDAVEGFVIMLAVDAVGTPMEPPAIGVPFTDLYATAITLHAAGQTQLADFIAKIDEGNIAFEMKGLPPPLRGKLEHSDYPMRVSVFAPDDAPAFADVLDAWDGIPDDAMDRVMAHEAEYWDADSGLEMAESLGYDKDALVGWLRAAAADGRSLFLFYETF